MNEYFNTPDAPVDFTPARASVVRNLFASIAVAFDLLPPRTAMLQGRVNYAVAGGDGNTLTASYTIPAESYVDGASFRLRLTNTNSGAATLNVDGLGAKQIRKSTGTALTGGELVAGAIQDFVYNSSTGFFHLPASGPQGPKGDTGPTGGTQLLNGSVAPTGGVGANGDFYMRTSAGIPVMIYGPKAAGVWPTGVNVTGPTGSNGTNGVDGRTLLNGTGAPSNALGANGDFYINNTAPKTIYGPKSGGAWPAGVSLKGDTGAAGTNGAAGVVDTTANYNFTHANGISIGGIEAGFRGLPIARSVAAATNLLTTDRGKAIINTGGAAAWTVRPNATHAIPVESVISFYNNGSGPITVTRGAGVVMKYNGADANRSLAVGGLAWLWKIDTDTWVIGGSGLT